MLKKIIGWALVTAGLAGEYFAVTDMRLDPLHVLIRMILVFGGVGILAGGIVLIAKSTTENRYKVVGPNPEIKTGRQREAERSQKNKIKEIIS